MNCFLIAKKLFHQVLFRTKPQVLRNTRKTASKSQKEPRQNRKLWRSQVYTAAEDRIRPVPYCWWWYHPLCHSSSTQSDVCSEAAATFAFPVFQIREAAYAHLCTQTGSQFQPNWLLKIACILFPKKSNLNMSPTTTAF